MNNDQHQPVTEDQLKATFRRSGMTSLSSPTVAHIRWNTKNAGFPSLAWRVLFQLPAGEVEFNVRNISIQPGFSNNFPRTVTAVVDNELKGNIAVDVTALHFELATRELVLFY